MRKFKQAIKFGVPLALVGGAASAAPANSIIDEAALVTAIEGAMSPVGAVAMAVLAILAAIMAYTLVRRVMGR